MITDEFTLVDAGFVDDDLELDQFEEGRVAAEHLAHHQFERALRGLELVALVFEFLELIDDPPRLGRVLGQRRVDGVDARQQRAAAGDFRHQHAAAVADQFRVDVLVGDRVLHHRVDVHAALVREGVAADVGRLVVVRHVGDFATERATEVRLRIASAGMHSWPSFSCRLGMIEQRLALPQRSPRPLMVPCTCVAPACTARMELATAISLSLWQWMPTAAFGKRAQTVRVMSKISSGKLPPLVSHSTRLSAPASTAAASVLQGVVGVVLVAVEEVLGVEHHFLAVLLQVAHGVADHGQVFFQRGAQDLQRLVVPALAEDGDGGGAGLEQRLHVGVVGDADADLARGAEGDDAGVGELQGRGAGEELEILRIRAGIAGLDVADAERVEPLDDLDLVVDRIGNALRLGAVAERGVVDGDAGHENLC